MATTNALRKAGWTEIEMVEVQNRRLDVRREHVGLQNEGLRGVNATAASVEEALGRLREVESKFSEFQAMAKKADQPNGGDDDINENERKIPSKQQRLAKIKADAQQRKMYKEGNLVHRTEPEVKTHTSYLVFAVLPREWNEEDEASCLERWPVDEIMNGTEKDDKTTKADKKTEKPVD
jgi:tRNA (adenine57-N1/adenine58-N1)-methyltransferase